MKNRRFGVTVLLTVALAGRLTAQEVPPILLAAADSGGPANRLAVTSVAIDARVSGGFARTSMTLTFFNPERRAVAGDLIFPLPERAVMTGYALDVEGVMVDGVAVERDRARIVFERIVRQGIDPGLVEWLAGNNFRTRVFPILARGTRTIRVSWLSELETTPDGLLYRLPLRFEDRVDELSVRVEVVRSTRQPVLVDSPLANLRFDSWRDSWVAETRIERSPADGDLGVLLPPATVAPVTVERSAENGTYFTIRDTFDPPVAPALGAVDRVTLYWDASRSAAEMDHERTLDLVEQAISRVGATTVDLVELRNVRGQPSSIRVGPGRYAALRDAVASIEYDGGTAPGALPIPDRRSDFAILVSDGHANLGASLPDLRGWPPVFAIATSSGANHALLTRFAALTGGAYLNAARLTDAEVTRRIGAPAYRLIEAQIDSGEVTDITPASAVVDGGVMVVSGRLASRDARVTLRYGFGDRITEERSFTIGAAVDGEVARLVWALDRLAELQADPIGNRQAMVRLGAAHGLVTPETSLIVLESLDQYVEHRIPPPSSLPAMRRAYFDRLGALDKEKERRRDAKIESVVAAWEERVRWWQAPHRARGSSDDRLPSSTEETAAAAIDEDVRSEGEAEEQGPPVSGIGGGSERMAVAAAGEALGDVASGPPDRSRDDGGEPSAPRSATISLEAWDPDTPYLRAIERAGAGAEEMYRAYLTERTEHGSAPAFYLDVGEIFFEAGHAGLGLRIWTNLAELEIEDPALLRVLAHRLHQQATKAATKAGNRPSTGRARSSVENPSSAELLELSRLLFERVLDLRPEEPQSSRDLALVLADLGESRPAAELLWEVVVGEWDRFAGIEQVALMELNELLRQLGPSAAAEIGIDPRVVYLLDVDLRVVLTWDADLTDMDLWVTEPTGQRVYYGDRRSTAGGHYDTDFTQGYGPEEYFIRRAPKGTYLIEVNYYGSSAPAVAGSVVLQVDVFTNYGRQGADRQSLTVQLRDVAETLRIGEVTL